MKEDVIIAGFGGQGVMLMGRLIAYAGTEEGLQVSWIPSYGPEMRGGTANCTVIVADRPIGSPVVQRPRTVIAMNLPSLEKFEPMVKSGGLCFMNSSLIAREPAREDVAYVMVPCNELARQLGQDKAANMVMLGAYLRRVQAPRLETVEQKVRSMFEHKAPEVARLNVEALHLGYEFKSDD